ncbi:MAG: DUF1287 domain-containing protein [Faecalibacillus sp.]
MKKKVILFIIIVLLCLGISILYDHQFIPHRQYENEDFHIETYISHIDQDNDGIDDQNDILKNVREYISTKPKYKSQYYASGYPNDGYGVCSDVVGFGLRYAGYDLQELVNEDIIHHQGDYQIDVIDKNIDFRRVRNLKIYFDHTAISLTQDIHQIDKWQGGDIVVFQKHIGVISDKRNTNGIPFVIHHYSPFQKNYEEDILEKRDDIVGHYRIS